MNDPTLLPPCAEFEFDLVEMVDGTLPAERARTTRAHLEGCARCRAWQAQYAELDAQLMATLPRPALSSDFDARLQGRLASETRRAASADLRTQVESDYRSLVDSLRSGARRSVLLTAGTMVVAALGATILLPVVWPGAGAALAALDPVQRATVLGGIGCAVALVALGWSAMQGALPGVRLGA
jgi:anti-sigma factor RsiW